MEMFEFRTFSDDEELEFRNVLFHTLHIPHHAWETYPERIGRENLRTLTRAGRLIGGMGIYRTGLWFGGKCVPCGGVSLVGVAPEQRRQGAARFLMEQSLREMRDEGTPLAALYASTQGVYRAVGFEQAGSRCEYSLPMTKIGLQQRELAVRQVPVDSHEPFEALYRSRAGLTNGHLERTPGLWQRILTLHDEATFGYLVGRPGEEEGYLIYRQVSDRTSAPRLDIRDWCALSAGAAERLWTFLSDHGSICESVNWVGPPTDPFLAVTAECKFTQCTLFRWMLRILNVEEALGQRGFDASLSEELHLDVRDDLLRENSGRYVLSIEAGHGSVTRGGRGDLSCDIRGLAPLYSGLFSAGTLNTMGWVIGNAASLRIANRIFSGPEPWMVEIF